MRPPYASRSSPVCPEEEQRRARLSLIPLSPASALWRGAPHQRFAKWGTPCRKSGRYVQGNKFSSCYPPLSLLPLTSHLPISSPSPPTSPSPTSPLPPPPPLQTSAPFQSPHLPIQLLPPLTCLVTMDLLFQPTCSHSSPSPSSSPSSKLSSGWSSNELDLSGLVIGPVREGESQCVQQNRCVSECVIAVCVLSSKHRPQVSTQCMWRAGDERRRVSPPTYHL